MVFDVTAADSFNFDIAGSNIVTIEALTITTEAILLDFAGAASAITFAGVANRRIANGPTGTFFGIETGDTFTWEINAVSEMTLSATDLDILANNIRNFGFIEQDGTVPTSGAIRLVDDSGLAWASGSDTPTLTYDVGRTEFLLSASYDLQSAPFLGFLQSDTSPATSLHDVGLINFRSFSSTSVERIFAAIYVQSEDNTNTTEEGSMQFLIMDGGSQNFLYMELNPGGNQTIDFFKPVDHNAQNVDNALRYTINDTLTGINQSGLQMRIFVDTSGSFNYRIGGANIATMTDTQMLFGSLDIATVGNISLNAGAKLTTDSDATEAGIRDIGHTADPSSPAAGDLYYNTTSNLYKFYNGTVWGDVAGAGGSQTPWLADIDADGFDLTDLSNILFRTTTGAPTATDRSIHYDDALGMTFNMLTGDDFVVTINGVETLDMNVESMKLTNWIQFNDFTGSPVAAETWIGSNASDLNMNVATGSDIDFLFNNVTTYTFTETEFDLQDNQIRWGLTTQTVGLVGDDLTFNMPTGGDYVFNVNGSDFMIINGSSSVIDLPTGMEIRWGSTTDREIFNTTAGMFYKVDSSDRHEWQVNGVPEMTLNI